MKDRLEVRRSGGLRTETQTLFDIFLSYDRHSESTLSDTELTIGPSEFYFEDDLRTFYCTKLARLVPKLWDFFGLEVNKS